MSSASPFVPTRARPKLPRRTTGPRVEDAQPEHHTWWERALREAVPNRYRYEKLSGNNCRLLIIEPRSSRPSEIYVELKEVSFADLGKPGYEYEALSYHWGNDKPTKVVYAQNDSSQMSPHLQAEATNNTSDDRLLQVAATVYRQVVHKKFYVRPNLYQALEHLRGDKEPTRLWVDALCIDQDNREEKKVQVSRMSEIYSRAQTVVVWLGSETAVSRRAMKFIDEVIDLENLNQLLENEDRVEDWSSLYSLIQSMWFSRRWVIQELALATDPVVFCGPDEVHWTSFRDAISLFEENFDKIRSLFLRSAPLRHQVPVIGPMAPLGAKVLVETINNIFRDNKTETVTDLEPTQGLEYLVSTLSTFETSDPRDTVHALRNIAKETSSRGSALFTTGRLPPEPDYSKNLLEVYSDFVGWVAETSGSIDILCRHWALPEKTQVDLHYPPLVNLPSWIQLISDAPYGRQDRAALGRIHGDSFVGLPGHSSYNASQGRKAEVRFGRDIVEKINAPAVEIMNQHPLSENGLLTVEVHRPTETLGGGATPVSLTKEPSASGQRSEPDPPIGSPADTAAPVVSEDTMNMIRSLGNKRKSTVAAAGATRKKPKVNINVPASNGIAVLDYRVSSPAPHITSVERASLNHHKKYKNSSIHIKGMVLGTIQWCTDPIPDGLIPNNALIKLGWNPEPEQNDVQVPDKVWRTLVAERGEDGRNPPAWYYRACCYCLVHKSPNGHINTRELLDHPRGKAQPDVVVRFLRRVQAVTWNRRFIEAVSRDGKLWHGIGPHRAQTKDLVCILYGCSVPVILRRHEDDDIGEFYTFQGESYVYGVMDGEAVSSMTASELDEKTESFMII